MKTEEEKDIDKKLPNEDDVVDNAKADVVAVRPLADRSKNIQKGSIRLIIEEGSVAKKRAELEKLQKQRQRHQPSKERDDDDDYVEIKEAEQEAASDDILVQEDHKNIVDNNHLNKIKEEVIVQQTNDGDKIGATGKVNPEPVIVSDDDENVESDVESNKHILINASDDNGGDNRIKDDGENQEIALVTNNVVTIDDNSVQENNGVDYQSFQDAKYKDQSSQIDKVYKPEFETEEPYHADEVEVNEGRLNNHDTSAAELEEDIGYGDKLILLESKSYDDDDYDGDEAIEVKENASDPTTTGLNDDKKEDTGNDDKLILLESKSYEEEVTTRNKDILFDSYGEYRKKIINAKSIHDVCLVAINIGIPLYNEKKDIVGCCRIYRMAAKHLLKQYQEKKFSGIVTKDVQMLLVNDISKALYGSPAWKLRHEFDEILSIEKQQAGDDENYLVELPYELREIPELSSTNIVWFDNTKTTTSKVIKNKNTFLVMVFEIIKQALYAGVPLYNDGNYKDCAVIYQQCATIIISLTKNIAMKTNLQNALHIDPKECSWELRNIFDKLLQKHSDIRFVSF